ncbi:MAG: Protoporphyrin IX magnesium-chelatase [Promethearchaeota archaeon]|nr:MAG: Protoporphyrin IX magnesium-chelatase [Candidatus Lokiarchaeota archaeon]
MTHINVYPFTGIVGQELMKLALILNAINPKINGVLIKGTKGTAKSTAVRALADLLPDIDVIKDCPYNCNPHNLKESCHNCQKRNNCGELTENDIISRKMKVVNLPINATEDRVVGTIDIKKALRKGLKALEPGILAEANRNILYIDEVNLLADNVADVLLDSAAMGINIIEREGISLHHPSNFILVGTMNPEEGNLRPQLLDRFGLSVDAENIKDIEKRVKIIKYAEEHHENPEEFSKKFEENQLRLKRQIINARKILPSVKISDRLLKKIAEVSIKLDVDSHRADITMNRTAKTIAAFKGRKEVNIEDIEIAAKLALKHRIRRLPFEENMIDDELIQEIMNQEHQKQQSQDKIEGEKRKHEEKELKSNPKRQQVENLKEEVFEINEHKNLSKILNNKSKKRKKMNTSGTRILHPTRDSRGKYIGGEKVKETNSIKSHDIAINETLNHACLESENQTLFKNGETLIVKDKNIHIKKRMGKSSYLIIFCVDASGSMGVKNRMEAVKGAIFSILKNNYVNRDKVSLVVFRKDKAEVILPPTRSTDLAYKYLKQIPTGGTTPLLKGLSKALDIAKEEKRKETGYIPLIILLSDARGNVHVNEIGRDLKNIGKEIQRNNIEIIILDTESSEIKLEICKDLAEASNAIYYHIDDIDEQEINEILNLEGILSQEYLE